MSLLNELCGFSPEKERRLVHLNDVASPEEQTIAEKFQSVLNRIPRKSGGKVNEAQKEEGNDFCCICMIDSVKL